MGRQNRSHLVPVPLNVFLLIRCVFCLVSSLGLLCLLLVSLVHEFFLGLALFTHTVELLQGEGEQSRLQLELVGIFFFLFLGVFSILAVCVDSPTIGCTLVGLLMLVVEGIHGFFALTRHLLRLVLSNALFLFLLFFVVLLLEPVKNFDKQINIGHFFDAQRFADGVNLDAKLFLQGQTLGLLSRFVVNEEWSFGDEQPEHIFDALILLLGRIPALASAR